MGMKIVVDDLSGAEIAAFLKPEITFWTVIDGDTLVGCGALKRLDAEHAEVKSMRTRPVRQRSGVASLLLAHIITEAKRMGFARLSLETGSDEFFLPARKLYEKFGFEYCAPFAEYRPDPYSAFMKKML